MLIQLAVLIIALSVAVVVAYLVSVLIQLRRTMGEAQQLLTQLNGELPALLKEARFATQNLNELTREARDGVGRASVLLHAVGEVGETVHLVHGLFRGQGGTLVSKLSGLVTGIRAASVVLKERFAKSDQEGNGKMGP